MSIKIYNGYKINSNNLKEIFDLLIKVRDDLRISTREYLNNRVIYKAYSILDNISLYGEDCIGANLCGEDIKDLTLSEISFKFCNSFFKQGDTYKQCFNYIIDLNSSLVVVPTNKEYSLLLGYIPMDLEFELANYSLIEEYCYFDNADRPDEITEEEWETRKEDWDTIGYEPPSCNGLTIETYGAFNYYRPYLPNILDKFELTEVFQHDRMRNLLEVLDDKEIDLIEKEGEIKGSYSIIEKARKIVRETDKYKEEKDRILKYVESTVYRYEDIKDFRFDILKNGSIIKK